MEIIGILEFPSCYPEIVFNIYLLLFTKKHLNTIQF